MVFFLGRSQDSTEPFQPALDDGGETMMGPARNARVTWIRTQRAQGSHSPGAMG
jgi:hypothetical protein